MGEFLMVLFKGHRVKENGKRCEKKNVEPGTTVPRPERPVHREEKNPTKTHR